MRAVFLMVCFAILPGCYDYSTHSDNTECSNGDIDCTNCQNGDCAIAAAPAPTAPAAVDARNGITITNQLLGSCWWERCHNGNKSLIPKIAGVNCVFIPKNGNDEFVVGACDDVGVCK